MRKIRILFATSALIATPAIFATSCSNKKNYEALTAEFKQQVINEFIELVKTPHISGHTREMANKLKGIFTSIPIIGEKINNTWYEDDYRAVDKDKTIIENSSGNICFDVDATKGCESWPGVVLQGHYDMVLAGEADKGVEAVIDGNTIHSKDYKSSLGADNGIGLSILITLLKNHEKFNHGPLRILLTSDEESDTSGANVIPTNCDNNKTDMVEYNNLINLDAEVDQKITVSCASTYSNDWTLQFIDKDSSPTEIKTDFIEEGDEYEKHIRPYTIKISGLKGGHSANEINFNRHSAFKVLSSILKTLNQNLDLNVIKFSCNNKSNAISTEAEVVFWIDNCSIDNINTFVVNPTEKLIKKECADDANVKIEITQSPGTNKVRRLNTRGSFKLYNALENIAFGPIEWIDDSLSEVATSANASKFSFDASLVGQEKNKSKMICSTFIRSCLPEHDKKIADYNSNCFKAIFGDDKVTMSDLETSPAWKYTSENKLHDIFAQGYKNIGINSTKRNAHSWLECAYFSASKKHSGDSMIAVGPLIKDSHSKNETLYLDTLDPLISSLLYTLKNIQNIHK